MGCYRTRRFAHASGKRWSQTMRRGQQSKGPGKEPAGQRTGGRALLRAATQHLRPSRRYDAPSHQGSLTGEKLSAPRHHTYFSRRTLWPRAVPFGRSLLPPLGAAASAPATGATVRAKEHPVPTGSQAKETRRKAGQGPGSVPGRHCLSAMPSSRRDGRELGSASGSSQASQGPEFVRNATTHELRSGDVVRALAPRFSPMASAPGPSGVMPWKTIPIPPASNELFYIHTFHLLPPTTCHWIIDEGEQFAAARAGWHTTRHKNYPTTDLPVKDMPAVNSAVLRLLDRWIFPFMGMVYNFKPASFVVQDLFIVKYEAMGQTHLATHRDGSLLSFNILLNDPKEFEGGHTRFEGLARTVPIGQGHIIMHTGKARHSGETVTRGTRYVLVGFINVRSSRLNQSLVQSEYWRTSSTRVQDQWLIENVLRRVVP